MTIDQSPDPIRILASLGVAQITQIERVRGGMAADIWRVQHGNQTSALRLLPASEASGYQHELAAMELAFQAGLPVPAVREVGLWADRPMLLLEWREGSTLADALRHQPWQVNRLGRAFGAMQARIHQLEVPELLGPSNSWIGRGDPADAALMRALQAEARPRPALLHMDYHLQNVLVRGASISAVLDWANVCVGDPRADLARSYTILQIEPYTPGQQPLWLTLMRNILTKSWQQGYVQQVGAVEPSALFYAWAGTYMVRDLAWRVESPRSWWRAEHLEQIKLWTAKQRALAQLED